MGSETKMERDRASGSIACAVVSQSAALYLEPKSNGYSPLVTVHAHIFRTVPHRCEAQLFHAACIRLPSRYAVAAYGICEA